MPPEIPAGHFYSPIPQLEEIDCAQVQGAFRDAFDVNEDAVLAFAEEIFSFAEELQLSIEADETCYQWCNGAFPPADALAYYGVLRKLKPERVIEVGAGFSSLVAVKALEKNGVGRLSCIDPYPQEFLRDMPQVELLDQRLQDVPRAFFDGLASGDVLFIDSSHQAKCQSDVLDIFFRILPTLPCGAYLHFHDIFLPDDYPCFWFKEQGLFYNEQYFLLAFLAHNVEYRVALPNAYLVRHFTTFYERCVGTVHEPRNSCFVNLAHGFIKAGSFWLQKRDASPASS